MLFYHIRSTTVDTAEQKTTPPNVLIFSLTLLPGSVTGIILHTIKIVSYRLEFSIQWVQNKGR